MILQIKGDSYSFDTNHKDIEAIREFFLENGEYKEKKGYSHKDGDPLRVECSFIGHLDQVPMQILNCNEIEKKYYKGAKAMVEKISGQNWEQLKTSAESVVNIHLPSSELFSVNAVSWIEDACTEQLQRQLDDGFRIIACIPRAGQRRPDYILGRYDDLKKGDE